MLLLIMVGLELVPAISTPATLQFLILLYDTVAFEELTIFTPYLASEILTFCIMRLFAFSALIASP